MSGETGPAGAVNISDDERCFRSRAVHAVNCAAIAPLLGKRRLEDPDQIFADLSKGAFERRQRFVVPLEETQCSRAALVEVRVTRLEI